MDVAPQANYVINEHNDWINIHLIQILNTMDSLNTQSNNQCPNDQNTSHRSDRISSVISKRVLQIAFFGWLLHSNKWNCGTGHIRQLVGSICQNCKWATQIPPTNSTHINIKQTSDTQISLLIALLVFYFYELKYQSCSIAQLCFGISFSDLRVCLKPKPFSVLSAIFSLFYISINSVPGILISRLYLTEY